VHFVFSLPMAEYRVEPSGPRAIVVYVDPGVTVEVRTKRPLEEAGASVLKHTALERLNLSVTTRRLVALRRPPASADAEEFDEDSYRAHGTVIRNSLDRLRADRMTTDVDAFMAMFEYVARSVHSSKWQLEANKNTDDPRFERFFTNAATVAWDSYGVLCDAMVASQAWDHRQADNTTFRDAVDLYPCLISRSRPYPTSGVCGACGRERVLSVDMTLHGDPYARGYQESTLALKELWIEQRVGPNKNTCRVFLVGSECASRIELYHALRHFLWHLVRQIGVWLTSNRRALKNRVTEMPADLVKLGASEFERSKRLLSRGATAYAVED